jgi:hypothetical protein
MRAIKTNFEDSCSAGAEERNRSDLFELVCDLLDNKLNRKHFNEWEQGEYYNVDKLVNKGLVTMIAGVPVCEGGEIITDKFGGTEAELEKFEPKKPQLTMVNGWVMGWK